jgi:pimeloyl-ACP methyl ester carboxylesterase
MMQPARTVRCPAPPMAEYPAGAVAPEFARVPELAGNVGLPSDMIPRVRRLFVDTRHGLRLSTIAWGTGPPDLVLLHRVGEDAHVWDAAALSSGRSAVAIDLPGHGASDGPAHQRHCAVDNEPSVSEVIQRLTPTSVLAGAGLGGLTALRVAAMRPDLCQALVLIDTAPDASTARHRAMQRPSGSRSTKPDAPGRRDNDVDRSDGHYGSLHAGEAWEDLRRLDCPVLLVQVRPGSLTEDAVLVMRDSLRHLSITSVAAGSLVANRYPAALGPLLEGLVAGVR